MTAPNNTQDPASTAPKMKEDQWYHAGPAAYLLEETLQDLSKAGGAIKAVTHCLQAVNSMDAPKADDDFNYLTLVESPDLYDALELLGKHIKHESNDLFRIKPRCRCDRRN